MSDPLNLSKRDRKMMIEIMRGNKLYERQVLTYPERVAKLTTPVSEPVLLTPTQYVCPDCKLLFTNLTKEHIVPQWLFNPSTLTHLGLRDRYAKQWHIAVQGNTRYICQICNFKKGGELRADHYFSRQFIKYLMQELQRRLDAVNVVVKVKVICKCNEA